MRRKLRDMPLFPLFPFVPLVLAGSLIALEGFILARLSKLRRSVDELAHPRPGIHAPA
jgi:hypothetical protein